MSDKTPQLIKIRGVYYNWNNAPATEEEVAAFEAANKPATAKKTTRRKPAAKKAEA